MIWVIAGTLDGRQLAKQILEKYGKPVFVSVVSAYGASLADIPGIEVYTGRLNEQDMERIIEEKGITGIIDASHPYAAVVTQTAIKACTAKKIPYIRFERSEVPLPEYDKLHHTVTEADAAKLAATLGNRIFLTTGSKTLPVFAKEPLLADKLVWTRVLPTSQVIKECEELGYSPKYIIGMQGPFSYESNLVMFRDTASNVVIMKNSGLIGGSDTKLQAAMDLNVHIILIDRPPLPNGIKVIHGGEELFTLWEEQREWNM